MLYLLQGSCRAANPYISYLPVTLIMLMCPDDAAKLRACMYAERGCPVKLSIKSIRAHERTFCKYHPDEKFQN